MQIGIIGATGKAGSLILKEAQARGHEVTAIVRNASKISDSSVNILEKNVLDLTNADLQGFDVVVNAFAAARARNSICGGWPGIDRSSERHEYQTVCDWRGW